MLLITGITGYSGNYFLRHLIDNNYEVPIRCTIRSNSNTSILDSSNMNIEKVICDLDDEIAIDDASSMAISSSKSQITFSIFILLESKIDVFEFDLIVHLIGTS